MAGHMSHRDGGAGGQGLRLRAKRGRADPRPPWADRLEDGLPTDDPRLLPPKHRPWLTPAAAHKGLPAPRPAHRVTGRLPDRRRDHPGQIRKLGLGRRSGACPTGHRRGVPRAGPGAAMGDDLPAGRVGPAHRRGARPGAHGARHRAPDRCPARSSGKRFGGGPRYTRIPPSLGRARTALRESPRSPGPGTSAATSRPSLGREGIGPG